MSILKLKVLIVPLKDVRPLASADGDSSPLKKEKQIQFINFV